MRSIRQAEARVAVDYHERMPGLAGRPAEAAVSYSAWLADAERREFTIRAGLACVREFEQEHGEFTAEELAEAEKWAAAAVVRARRSGARTHRRA